MKHEINQPETSGMSAIVKQFCAEIMAVKVVDAKTFAFAVDKLKRVKTMMEQVKDLFDASKSASHHAHKSICAAESSLLNPLKDVDSYLRREASAYETEQRRIALEEQRRIEAEARKREEERKLAEAIEAEKISPELAEEIMNEPVITPVVHVAPAVPKVEGVSNRTRWTAEVVDFVAFGKACIERPELRHLITVNQPALNTLARAMKNQLSIPGVKSVETQEMSVRL